MAEDEEFVTREESPRLGNLLGGDGGDRVAFVSFGIALDEDAGGGAETSYEIHFLKGLYFHNHPLTPRVPVGDGRSCVGIKVGVCVGVGVNVGVSVGV